MFKKLLGIIMSIAFIAMATHYRIEDGAAPAPLVFLALFGFFYIIFNSPREIFRKYFK